MIELKQMLAGIKHVLPVCLKDKGTIDIYFCMLVIMYLFVLLKTKGHQQGA